MAPVSTSPSVSRSNLMPVQPQAGSLGAITSDPSSFLCKGAAGPGIAGLQTMLKKAGFDPQSGTPPDGKFGQKTFEALQAFQRSRGLAHDGVVGPETRDALLSKAGPKLSAGPRSDGFEVKRKAPVTLAAPQPLLPPNDVVATARTELGKNAKDVKLGSDTIGKAMRDDVSNWKCCANFVGATLLAAGQIGEKDLSASVDGLVGKLEKTGKYTETHSLDGVQPGDVVAFDHAHVMICSGFDAKTGQPTFIGSNNDNADGSQKISEGPLRKWFAAGSKTLQAWTEHVVVLHRTP